MKLLNLCQHALTADQREALFNAFANDGPVEIHDIDALGPGAKFIRESADEGSVLRADADWVASFIDYHGYQAVHLPGGSPAFMWALSQSCQMLRVQFLFSHSERVSVEAVQEDGSVLKTSTFAFKRLIFL